MIEGRVARVLNAQELILNRGLDDGVTPGVRFAVIDPKTENIVDPDTGEDLGSIWRPKILVEAVEVDKRLTLARTFRTTTVNVGGIGSPLVDFEQYFKPRRYVQQVETFSSPDQAWEEIDEESSVVSVGDKVVEVTRNISDSEHESGVVLRVEPAVESESAESGEVSE